VRATKVADGRVGSGRESRALACSDDFVEIVDREGGMRARGRVKVGYGFDAEMELNGTRGEPDAVASGHRGGLLLLGEAQDAYIKGAGDFFVAGRNRDLHVIDAKDWHRYGLESGDEGSGPPPAQGETQK
jgi:hypothetical protein